MGPENLTPLEELKRLDQQIDQAGSLAALQPLFARLEEIARQHPSDFEVQIVAHDVKQHMLARGSALRKEPPPAPLAAAPPAEAETSTPIPSAPPPPQRRKPWLWIAAAAGILAVGAIGLSVLLDRQERAAATEPVDITLATVPTGAQILVDGEPTCQSDCVAKLTPGTYQVSAQLDGFETATREITVTPRKPDTWQWTLTPLTARLRILTDLESGQVFVDEQPAGELEDGQFVVDQLPAGTHAIRVASGRTEAQFTVETQPGILPQLQGTVSARNLIAVLVSSLGNQAKLASSGAAAKLTVNGQPQPDTAAEGVEITAHQPGVTEIALGEGPQQQVFRETFGSGPELTAFLKSDPDIGTLIVATGEDDARVFLNNREYRRRTQKGQVRIQTIGNVTVRVQKPGFEDAPAQTAVVRKGQETRMEFTLKALPQTATLVISGGTAGAEVLLGQRVLGQVGADGGYRNTAIPPGDHTVELRREGFEPRRFTRSFRAGQTVSLSGTDSTLAAIRVAPAAPPPPPPPAPPPPKPPPPKRAEGGMAQFDSPGAWQEADGIWRHRGAATLTYSLRPDGIFTFSIYMLRGGSLLRSGRVRWFLHYTDAKNYILFEMDEENFWSRVVENGKQLERKKVAHKQDKRMRVWNIQIDVSASRLVHKIQGDDGWLELDNWSEPGRDFTRGKFGILVNGNDEVGLSNFQFTGR